MSDRPRRSRSERMTILTGIVSLMTVILVLQLWLLTATMNAWLGADEDVVWPAFFASAGCLLLGLGLLRYLFRR